MTETTKHVTGKIILDIAPSAAQVEVMLQRGNPKFAEDGVTPALGSYGKQDYDFLPGTRYSLSVGDQPTILSLMGSASMLILTAWLEQLAVTGAIHAVPSEAQIGAAIQAAAAGGDDMHHALVTPLEALAADYWAGQETTAVYRRWDG